MTGSAVIADPSLFPPRRAITPTSTAKTSAALTTAMLVFIIYPQSYKNIVRYRIAFKKNASVSIIETCLNSAGRIDDGNASDVLNKKQGRCSAGMPFLACVVRQMANHHSRNAGLNTALAGIARASDGLD